MTPLDKAFIGLAIWYAFMIVVLCIMIRYDRNHSPRD